MYYQLRINSFNGFKRNIVINGKLWRKRYYGDDGRPVAEMLRELQYHQKGYYISEFLGNPFRYSDNLVKVDFEEDKKFMTYLKRYIGKCLW